RMNDKIEQGAVAAQVAAAKVPSRDGLLGLAVAVVVIAGLFLAKDVLIPITLAVLLSFVLSPIVLFVVILFIQPDKANAFAALGAMLMGVI
ncbi:hypothetical protein LTR94_028669, partial [Friedmanniomyces endolithicus]